MGTAELIIQAIQIYCLIGAAVAVAFLLFGIEQIDPGAKSAHAFRPLLIPGVLVLWPLVLVLWLQHTRRDDPMSGQ